MIGNENGDGDDDDDEDDQDDENDDGKTCNYEPYCAIADCSLATAQTLCPEKCPGINMILIESSN